MRHIKEDFQIIFEDHNRFSIKVRKRFLKFFYIWVPVTYQEAEHTEDVPVEFATFDEAVSFIDNITV